MWVTGYVPYTPSVPSTITADGTSVFAGEALAAHVSLPFGTMVDVSGLAKHGLATTYRIADRGWLQPDQLDILIWDGSVQSSVAKAYQITGRYLVCW